MPELQTTLTVFLFNVEPNVLWSLQKIFDLSFMEHSSAPVLEQEMNLKPDF